MINNIHIENFQSHKDTEVKFTKGVNVIVGQSDSGKSVILRALNWCINNKPGGNSFCSSWGGETLVTVDDVKRRKTKSKNEYYVNDNFLKAFGVNPPEEVKEYFNMEDINWQSQHDKSFLLSETAGEVARKLNKTVDLDIIDRSQTNINKKILANNQDRKYADENIDSLETQLESFKDLKKRERALKKIIKKDNYSKALRKDFMVLNTNIVSLIQTSEKKKKLQILLSLENKLSEIEDKRDKCILSDSKALEIESCINTLTKVKEAREVCDCLSYEGLIQVTTKKVEDREVLEQEILSLKELIKCTEERNDKRIVLDKTIKELEKQLPKECPTCGGELK